MVALVDVTSQPEARQSQYKRTKGIIGAPNSSKLQMREVNSRADHVTVDSG